MVMNFDSDISSMYPHSLRRGVVQPMDQLTTAIKNSWGHWYKTKDMLDFGFRDWCKRVNGFEYTQDRIGGPAVITKIHDEQKYAWFLLKWA